MRTAQVILTAAPFAIGFAAIIFVAVLGLDIGRMRKSR